MRSLRSGRRDRVLAAIEIPALGIWLGALAGFAFISAPLSFRAFAALDIHRFAALMAASLGGLTTWGYVLGAIAIVVALLRAVTAGDRTWDLVRAALVAVALGLASYEQRAVIPAMEALTDPHDPAYLALHGRSTGIYGAEVILILAALVLAAARRDE
jgi:uncharacterized protein DUF4149